MIVFDRTSQAFKQFLLVASTVIFLSTSAFALTPDNSTVGKLEPTTTHSKTVIDILNQLRKRHYVNQAFGDGLSSRFLDNYLARLDRNRTILLQSDIEEFNKYRYQLDDELKRGKLDIGFMMFNRYQERLDQRLTSTIDALPDMLKTMDFTKDESITIDRSEAAWPKNQAEAEDLWRKQIKSRVLSLQLAGKEPEDILPLLQKRYQNQLHRVWQSNSEDVFEIYINSLSELYDPHTRYFSPANSENFNINMSLSLEGIGAVLQTEDEHTKVVRLVHAGPADKQGDLQPSDKIIGVAQGKDGEFQDVIGLRLDEVVKLIRGPKGSVVKLEVIPVSAKPGSDNKIIEIVRNTVKLEEQSAKKEMIEVPKGDGFMKVGVIDIPTFYIDFEAMRKGDPNYKSTTRDVRRLLGELLEDGAEGIIIDLRDNGGGSLQEANSLTGLFVGSGPTVQLRHTRTQVMDRPRSNYYDGPLVVMINRLSASASEIFAGAIQDYQRGIIVGSQSFGKGTVQALAPLHQGQLKITESKFYRISGESTQHRGVVPDISFPTIYDKEKVGESSLDNALIWDRIDSISYNRYFDLNKILPKVQAKHLERISTDPDFIFLQDQITLLEDTKKITTIPLNEAKRAEQREKQEAKQLAIENKRRKAKGLDLLADLDEIDAKDEDSDESPDLAENTENPSNLSDNSNEIDESDPLLMEAANILADSVPAYINEAYAIRPDKGFDMDFLDKLKRK